MESTGIPQDDGVRLSLPAVSEPFQEEQTMLILVGLVASGKSTFADALEHHLPRFRRCNQDDLDNRQRVEELAYRTLCEGRSPCIDRTNFNAVQRSYWSSIARAFPGTSISMIVFDAPYHVCASRLERRSLTSASLRGLSHVAGTSHPTIRDAQHGLTILQKFASDFQLPSPGEGYDHIIYLRPEDHPRPEYTRDELLSILKRLKASTRDSESSVAHHSRFGAYSRADRTRGHRGGAGYWRTFSPTRWTLYGPSRTASRAGGPNSLNWRHPGPGAGTNREASDQRSAATGSTPPMEGSKASNSAGERGNSS